ncbi:MAG: hypothetical protein P8X47_02510, partial [Ignavibacteriaceae bacterium]
MILSIFLFAQEVQWISLIEGEKSQSIPSYNYQGTIYVSVKHLADALSVTNVSSNDGRDFELEFSDCSIQFKSNNPFIVINIKDSAKSIYHQLPTSSHFINNTIFVPLNEILELFNEYSQKSLIIISPGRIFVLPKQQKEINTIRNVSVSENEKGTFLKINTALKVYAEPKQENQDTYSIIIRKASTLEKNYPDLFPTELVRFVDIKNVGTNVEIVIKKKSGNVAAEFFTIDNRKELIIHLFNREDSPLLERESDHFRVIYREYHSYLINNILINAERAFEPIARLFNYTPTDKIVIATYDASDYGYAATITTPQNIIRFEIEPLESGYEIVPYNERIQWLLSHEIVHIVVNDAQVGIESFFRKIFGK